MPISLAINGACGRMGLTVARIAAESKDFEVEAALEGAKHPSLGKSYEGAPKIKVQSGLEDRVDVVVDFSTPDAVLARLKECVSLGVAVVVGTTGLTPVQEQEIAKASKKIACVRSSNWSVGVNALLKMAPQLAATLGTEYDIDLVEAHHRGKKDAPSGTAKMLAENLGRPVTMHSLRSGDEVGEHRLVFGGPGERIEIVHRATSREVFARGALRAAKFAAKAKPGLYSMLDVLGLG